MDRMPGILYYYAKLNRFSLVTEKIVSVGEWLTYLLLICLPSSFPAPRSSF